MICFTDAFRGPPLGSLAVTANPYHRRTGPFFSFDRAGITPDMACLSQSISGYGLPPALTLIRPELDVWEPGEHNGTFRGFNPALVAGAVALHAYWQDRALELRSLENGQRVAVALSEIAAAAPDVEFEPRSCGIVHRLAFTDSALSARVSAEAFERVPVVETVWPQDEVVPLLPPLAATDAELDQGLTILADAVCIPC